MAEEALTDLELFFEETRDILKGLQVACLAKGESQDFGATFKKIERGVHTIKGNAAAFGFEDFSLAALQVLKTIRASESKATVSGLTIDVLKTVLMFVDRASEFLTRTAKEEPERPEFFKDIIEMAQACHKPPLEETKGAPPQRTEILEVSGSMMEEVSRILANAPEVSPQIQELARLAGEELARESDEGVGEQGATSDPAAEAAHAEPEPRAQDSIPEGTSAQTKQGQIDEFMTRFFPDSPASDSHDAATSTPEQQDVELPEETTMQTKINNKREKRVVADQTPVAEAVEARPPVEAATPPSVESPPPVKIAAPAPTEAPATVMPAPSPPAKAIASKADDKSVSPIMYGYAFEAWRLSQITQKLSQLSQVGDVDLSWGVPRIADLIVKFSQLGWYSRSVPVSKCLEQTVQWAQNLGSSRGCNIRVELFAEPIRMLPQMGTFINKLLQEIITASLQEDPGQDPALTELRFKLTARRAGDKIAVAISGLPTLVQTAAELKIFDIQERLNGLGGSFESNPPKNEVVLHLPLVLHCIDVMVAGTGSTMPLAFPLHRVLDVMQGAKPQRNGAQISIDWKRRTIDVMDLRQSTDGGASGDTGDVIVLSVEDGVMGVWMESVVKPRSEMLVEAIPPGHSKSMIFGACISIKEGRRIPLVIPRRHS